MTQRELTRSGKPKEKSEHQETEESFEARITVGDSSYFAQEGKPKAGLSAFYVGPRRPGEPLQRHLTIISDIETGELRNIHLTHMIANQRKKKWQIIPAELEPKATTWIDANSNRLDVHDAKTLGKNSYCVSAWRVIVGFAVIERLLTIAGWLIVRPMISLGVVTFKEERHGRWRRFTGDINISRLIFLVRKLRPFKRLVGLILPVLIVRAGPNLSRLLMTKPERMANRDILLIVPKTAGVPASVLVKWKQFRMVDFGKVFSYATELFEQLDLKELLPNLATATTQTSMPIKFDVRQTGPNSNLE